MHLGGSQRINVMNTRSAALLVTCLLLPASAAFPGEPAQTSSGIVLGPDLDGRFHVHDARGELVADLDKPAGRTVEVGLEPGSYDVVYIVYGRELLRLAAHVTLDDGERKPLDRAGFHPIEHVAAAPQRHAEAERPKGLSMDGRTRLELFGGFTDSYVEVETGHNHVDMGGGQGGLAISHWLREDVALDFQLLATDLDVAEIEEGPWDSTETRASLGLLFGARYYFPKATFGGTFRPYAAAAIGPFSEYYSFSSHHHTEVHHDNTRIGGQLGGGVDFQLSRLFSFGVKLAVIFREGYDPSFGSTFGFGFAWGKGRR